MPGTPAPNAKYVSAGAYWTNGASNSTEFTVSDEQVHQWNPINGLVSQPLYNLNPNGPCGEGNCTGYPGFETLIIPKPGSECGVYYIIYSYFNSSVGAAFNKESVFSFSTYSVDLNTPIVTNTLQSIVINNTTHYGELFTTQFAVSKKNSSGQRFLYAVVPFYNYSISQNVKTRLYKYAITSSGIQEVDFTPGIANNYIEFNGVIAPTEVELSHDQTMLAFARKNIDNFPNSGLSNAVDLVIVKLDPATGNLLNGSLGNIFTHNLTDYIVNGDSYTGLEFSSSSQFLYINNSGDGIRKFTISSSQLSDIIPNSDLYTDSQLELRYFQNGSNDQRICAVRNDNGTYRIGYFNSSIPTPIMGTQNLNFTYTVGNSFPKINNVFTLPDQVDGVDYSTWSNKDNSSACCTRFFVPNDDDGYTPPGSGNLTWNPGSGLNPFNSIGTVVFRGDFVVVSGQNLTINNMTLRFHPGSKVIVQPNAKLYLNNTKLTGLDCNSTWDGVRLYGNRSLTQTYANQGFLSAYNLSEISHATVGLATWNLETGNINTSGGWAICNDVNFRNNKKDLDMVSYPNANQTAFYRCNFTINDSYRFGTTLDHRAQLAQVTNVKFHGCTFANDCTQDVAPLNNPFAGKIIFAPLR